MTSTERAFRDLNEQLSTFCRHFLGRPTHRFDNQTGVPDACWEGPGFYLLKLEQDGAVFLGEDFDDAWKKANTLAAEARSDALAEERRRKRDTTRERIDQAVDSAERGIRSVGRLFKAFDDVVEDGLRRARGALDVVELMRGDDEDDDEDDDQEARR